MVAGKSEALSKAPVRDGSMPVIIEAREGAHSGELQYARSKITPPSASASMFGA